MSHAWATGKHEMRSDSSPLCRSPTSPVCKPERRETIGRPSTFANSARASFAWRPTSPSSARSETGKRYLSYFAHVRDLLRAVAFCLVSLRDVTSGNSAGEYFSSRSLHVTGEAGEGQRAGRRCWTKSTHRGGTAGIGYAASPTRPRRHCRGRAAAAQLLRCAPSPVACLPSPA